MAFFKIIIPNYNNAGWLPKCLDSVMSQTFRDHRTVVIDDCSTDDSRSIIERYSVDFIALQEKRWNGGTRNVGIMHEIDSEYTLFLDSDDWFLDANCLQMIHDRILSEHHPDCVSLSYKCLIGNSLSMQPLIRNTPKELVDSVYVACWTKCVKTDLVQLFPENTLMEDVVQHIKQCDVIRNVWSMVDPVICWNRNNVNSCSRVENQNLQNGKWQSSMYRYAADLMDLELEHDYCERHRQWRLEVVLNNIRNGVYLQ